MQPSKPRRHSSRIKDVGSGVSCGVCLLTHPTIATLPRPSVVARTVSAPCAEPRSMYLPSGSDKGADSTVPAGARGYPCKGSRCPINRVPVCGVAFPPTRARKGRPVHSREYRFASTQAVLIFPRGLCRGTRTSKTCPPNVRRNEREGARNVGSGLRQSRSVTTTPVSSAENGVADFTPITSSHSSSSSSSGTTSTMVGHSVSSVIARHLPTDMVPADTKKRIAPSAC